MSLRPGARPPQLDLDTEELLGEFFISLTFPDALNPDGWFQKLSNIRQDDLKALSQTWHLQNWYIRRQAAEKSL